MTEEVTGNPKETVKEVSGKSKTGDESRFLRGCNHPNTR